MNRLTTMAMLLAALPLLTPVAHADPSDYVRTPLVEQGEREIEFKFGSQKLSDGSSQSAASLGLGYGATSWWFTEVYGKVKNEGGQTFFDAVEWENKFQLTPTGKYPVDVGLLLELERPQDRSEGYEVTYGLLMQSEWDRVQGNLNLLLQRHYQTDQQQTTVRGYQWQVKYRYRPELEFGAQGFGWLDKLDDGVPNGEQEHKLGPALFGQFKIGPKEKIKYNVAWLIGTTSATARNTVRTQLEYEY